MKTIIINASPRKNQNTAQLLKSAQRGAEAAGAEVEYIDLYDLNFSGCCGCLRCKLKGAERCRCYWKDELSQVIDKVFNADALLIGTPIYFGRPTAAYFAFIERLLFPMLSYDDYSSYFKGKVNVTLFLTMNSGREFFDRMYKPSFDGYAAELGRLNGKVEVYPCCDTLQVADYSQFSMNGFDENAKKKVREGQFPKDLQNAYKIGLRSGK